MQCPYVQSVTTTVVYILVTVARFRSSLLHPKAEFRSLAVQFIFFVGAQPQKVMVFEFKNKLGNK